MGSLQKRYEAFFFFQVFPSDLTKACKCKGWSIKNYSLIALLEEGAAGIY